MCATLPACLAECVARSRARLCMCAGDEVSSEMLLLRRCDRNFGRNVDRGQQGACAASAAMPLLETGAGALDLRAAYVNGVPPLSAFCRVH